MKFKAIIFDMDGTILNSEDHWSNALLQLLKAKTNAPLAECKELLTQFKGASSYTSCSFIKKVYNLPESVEELMQEKDNLVLNDFSNLISFIDGFERFHKKITELGLKSAIATNAHKSSFDIIQKHMALDSFFKEHLYCIDHVQHKAKPLPDVYLYAAHQLEIDPAKCIAIEDSSHGIAAAKAAGMFCIGINTGQDLHALKKADLIIHHYDEIVLENLLF